MSGNNVLSQAEIDALLREGSTNASDSDLDFDLDALGEIGNIAFGSGATTLSTLLQRKVSITVPQVELITTEELCDAYPLPLVVINVEYTRGLQGINALIIKEEDAKIIASLMMGGDGTAVPDSLDELTLSAVAEAMNQMMGSAATSMSTLFDEVVEISPPSIVHLDLSVDEFDVFNTDGPMVKVSFQMKVGDLIDSIMMLLLTPEFARKMTEKLVANFGSEEPQRQAQPAAAPMSQPSNSYDKRESVGEQRNNTEPIRVQPAQFAPLKQSSVANTTNIELILDVPLQLTVELGRTQKTVGEILDMGPGTIIELSKLAGEPVDIYVNGKLIAKGEVVVIEENFAVRLTDIVSVIERVNKLQ